MFTPGTKLVKAVKAQVAIDGNYEEALQIHAPYSDYSKEDIEKLLSSFNKSISIEFFYETSDDRVSYFGMKYEPDQLSTIHPQEFVYRSLDTFALDQGFDNFIPAIGKALNGDKTTFLSSRPDQIELGVNEWWFTFGPLVIWKDGDHALTKQNLIDRLSDREDLKVNPKNFVGAEIIFMAPIKHWLSTQVSQSREGKYILNIDQVLSITGSVQ